MTNTLSIQKARAELSHQAEDRIKRNKPEALSVSDVINQVWSMGFISDSLIDGCSRDDDTCKY